MTHLQVKNGFCISYWIRSASTEYAHLRFCPHSAKVTPSREGHWLLAVIPHPMPGWHKKVCKYPSGTGGSFVRVRYTTHALPITQLNDPRHG